MNEQVHLMSTPLGEKIKSIIKQTGPITVSDYFALCLADPDHGYYKTREPFGGKGDFTTAPEISQLFGEMVGIFVVEAWQKLQQPDGIHIVEIGPGRGTMMADILRVIQQLSPALLKTANLHLVETSERLRAVQAEKLRSFQKDISWHNGFDEVPQGPVLLVANELFDAIPIRQFVKTDSIFKERMVALNADDELIFAPGLATIDPSLLPGPAEEVPQGTIVELAPARLAVMQAICERMAMQGGATLIIDYGHTQSGFGDTLQAIRAHRFDAPLAHPGEADLTSHVDFQDLERAAELYGLNVAGLITQGEFLLNAGILERAGALGRGKDEQTQSEITNAVERLAGDGPGQMGSLFKVLAITNPPIALSAFNTAQSDIEA